MVVNPPYVPVSDALWMDDEITQFEPPGAGFAQADGRAAYRALAPSLARVLRPQGRVVLELGEGQAEPVEGIFASHGLETIDRRRDLAGRWRCLVVGAAAAIKKPLPASEKKRCKLGAGG